MWYLIENRSGDIALSSSESRYTDDKKKRQRYNKSNTPADHVFVWDDRDIMALFQRPVWDGAAFVEGGPPVLTPALLTAEILAATQQLLDAQARTRGYDNILSAVSYADEPAVPAYQAEGVAMRAWRSAVWQAALAAVDATMAGTATYTNAAEVIATLPAFPGV